MLKKGKAGRKEASVVGVGISHRRRRWEVRPGRWPCRQGTQCTHGKTWTLGLFSLFRDVDFFFFFFCFFGFFRCPPLSLGVRGGVIVLEL